MDASVEPIPLQRLALLFVPILIVVVIQIRWALSARTSLYAIGRMTRNGLSADERDKTLHRS